MTLRFMLRVPAMAVLAMLFIGPGVKADDPACGTPPFFEFNAAGWSTYKQWCRDHGGTIADNYNTAQAEGGCHGCSGSGNSAAANSNSVAPGHQGDEIIAKSLSAGLSGQLSGADAMGGIGVGILLNMLFTPGNNGQAAAEAERRRQAHREQPRLADEARRAAEEAKRRKFNADKAELSSQLRGGAGELEIKGSGADLSLKDIENPGLTTGNFNEYRDWEAHKREVLAFQSGRTLADPGNQAVESWCKLHLPLSQASGEIYTWECKCYRCPASAPVRNVLVKSPSTQAPVTVGGMVLKDVDVQVARQGAPGQLPLAAMDAGIPERDVGPALMGTVDTPMDDVEVTAHGSAPPGVEARRPPDLSALKALQQLEQLPVDLNADSIEQIHAAGESGFDNQHRLMATGDVKIPDAIPVEARKPAPAPVVQPAESPVRTEAVRHEKPAPTTPGPAGAPGTSPGPAAGTTIALLRKPDASSPVEHAAGTPLISGDAAPRKYIESGRGMVGGTTWAYGFKRTHGCGPVCEHELQKQLCKQYELASGSQYGNDFDTCVKNLPFQPDNYDFVVSMAYSQDSLLGIPLDFLDITSPFKGVDRVLRDGATLGNFSKEQREIYASLKGRSFDTLECHSNGAMLCLAALMSGDAKAKKVLLFGPQINERAAALWEKYQKSTGTKVTIYINTGDPIPGTSWNAPSTQAELDAALSDPLILAKNVAKVLASYEIDAAKIRLGGKSNLDLQLARHWLEVKRFPCSDRGLMIDIDKCHSALLYKANESASAAAP